LVEEGKSRTLQERRCSCHMHTFSTKKKKKKRLGLGLMAGINLPYFLVSLKPRSRLKVKIFNSFSFSWK
jgi:hypothetical protein